MFPTSSQSRHWMFKNEEAIQKIKLQTNSAFVSRHSKGQPSDFFLTPENEAELDFYFSKQMEKICEKFKPPMPNYVKGTSFHYFKRFYLNNSMMDYHPKEILVTAVYLACKVEEFNVSMQQFVANIPGNQEKATKVILNNELLLMQELKFHLTIHNPYRAMEGLLIDIKTRYSLADVESWRTDMEEFLSQVYLTNSIMIYSPSQIALAAIIHSASRQQQNVDSYVTDKLFHGQSQEAILHIITCVRNIRVMVKNLPQDHSKDVGLLIKKLEQCRNQENNPDSAAYKRKLEELVDEEDLIMEVPSKQARMDGVSALSPGGG